MRRLHASRFCIAGTPAEPVFTLDGAVPEWLFASGKVLVDTKDVASAKQLVGELAKSGFIGEVTYRKFDCDSGPRNDC